MCTLQVNVYCVKLLNVCILTIPQLVWTYIAGMIISSEFIIESKI